MATLADAGSTQTSESNPYTYSTPQTSENNPYQQALQGNYFDKRFAGVTATQPKENSTYDPNAPNPPQQSSNNTPSKDSIAAQEQALEGNYPTASQSVENTPEAMSKSASDAEENSQKEAAFSATVNPKSKGAQPPTEQQDVNAALAPDESLLDQIPSEYASVINQLSPYLDSGTNTGNSALDAADANVSSVVGQTDNKVEAALTGMAKGVKESAGTVPYNSIIQALLGFGKYEETYEGAQPQGQSDWSQSMDAIYAYLSGTSASSNGLPTPTVAASTGAANQTSTDSLSGGGNT